MGVSSTLVNISEDAELRLVSVLTETSGGKVSSNFEKDCSQCISSGNIPKLVQTILNDKGAVAAFMAIEPEEEAVGAFTIVAALLDKADPQSKESFSTKLADALLADSSSSDPEGLPATERKVLLLSVLYNMRSSEAEKCAVLARMFQLGSRHPAQFLSETSTDQTLARLLRSQEEESMPINYNAAQVIIPTTPRLVSMMDAWNVSAKERRNMYQTIVDILPSTDKRKQRFLILLVETYSTDAAVDAQGKAAGQQAAMGAIRDPISLFQHQRNLLHQPAVKALASTDVPLLGLLQVFQEGKLSDYQAYLQKNGGDKILQKWGLDAAACERNMKILSICSLAAEHEEIPYKVIAETLQLAPSAKPSEGVESWVIKAVSSGLLEAKMDQLAEKVMVERCVVRRFDMDQWKILQRRLHVWKQNVGGILTSLKQSQAAVAPVTP